MSKRALFLAVSSSFSLFACGGDGSGGGDTTNDPQITQAVEGNCDAINEAICSLGYRCRDENGEFTIELANGLVTVTYDSKEQCLLFATVGDGCELKSQPERDACASALAGLSCSGNVVAQPEACGRLNE